MENRPIMTIKGIKRNVWRQVDRLECRAESSKALDFVYRRLIIPVLVALFKIKGNTRKIGLLGKTYAQSWEYAQEKLSTPEEMRRLKNDIIASYLMYHVDPEEYFLYDFPHRGRKERITFLSDFERMQACKVKMGPSVFAELTDKARFYQYTAPYFKREVCVVAKEEDWDAFAAFAQRHGKFFLKMNGGTGGWNCSVVDRGTNYRELFEKLISHDFSWLAEELIEQSDAMAAWNASSVNTVRLSSFRTSQGFEFDLALMRTGRKGSVVDNCNAGGAFAVIDAKTGIITTDGIDEFKHVYPKHPDSGVPFKGTQLPEWDSLLALTEKVHAALPESFHYVGFDYAHTKNGWVLIEGNWGQLVAYQIFGKGIRKLFEEAMGVTKLQALHNMRK